MVGSIRKYFSSKDSNSSSRKPQKRRRSQVFVCAVCSRGDSTGKITSSPGFIETRQDRMVSLVTRSFGETLQMTPLSYRNSTTMGFRSDPTVRLLDGLEPTRTY